MDDVFRIAFHVHPQDNLHEPVFWRTEMQFFVRRHRLSKMFTAVLIRGFAAVSVLICPGAPANSASLEVATPPPRPAWKIVHAGMVIHHPLERAQREVSIIIRDDMIDRIERGYLNPTQLDGVAEGDPVEVIDLRDATVLPGLIDAHVHLTISYGGRTERYFKSDAELTVDGMENAYTTLMAGYTTVRDVADGSDGAPSIALRDALQKGRVAGPRMYASGPALSPTGGHSDPPNSARYKGGQQSSGVCDGPEDCQRAVRWNYRMGADLIKFHATGGGSEEAGAVDFPPSFSQAEMDAIVEATHALRRRVTAHAHGPQGINAALRARVDSIEHGSFLNEESIKLFLQNGAWLVPTMSVLNELDKQLAKGNPGTAGRNAQFVAEMPGNIAAAYRAGVKIAAGSDAGVVPHGENARELERYVSIGMTPAEALAAATVHASELLAISDKVGTLEPGKWADLIAVERDPLQDISALQRIRFVMKGGKVFKDN